MRRLPKIKKHGDVVRKQQQELIRNQAHRAQQATIALNKVICKRIGTMNKFYTVWQTTEPGTLPIGTSATLSMLKSRYPNTEFYKRTRVGRMKFDPSMNTLPVLTRNDL